MCLSTNIFTFTVRHHVFLENMSSSYYKVVEKDQFKLIRGVFWRGVWSDQKMMTANMFLVMRQNDFSHDQDHDFLSVFKFCYFTVNKYLQHMHLLHSQRLKYSDI